MENWTFWLVVGLYLAAGGVIIKCLRKMKMWVAFTTFSVLYITIAMYIPAVLGSGICEILSRPLIELLPEESIYSFLLARAPYFTVTTIVIAVVSVIFVIATVLLSVRVVLCVTRLLRKVSRRGLQFRPKNKRLPEPIFEAGRIKRKYIEFCRLLD